MSLLLTFGVCGTWLLLTLAFASLGVVALRWSTGPVPADWHHAFLSIWTGFVLLLVFLTGWHFLLPVNAICLFVFVIASALALYIERRWFITLFRQPRRGILTSAVILIAIWTANHSLAGPAMDDFNYEFQAIRWYHDYSIVPGLANVHGRIGFNNIHHLYAAMLSNGPWAGLVNHIFNGLFIILAAAALIHQIIRISERGVTPERVVAAVLLAPVLGMVLFGIFGPLISTLKVDLFVTASTAVLVCLYSEFLRRDHLADGVATILTACAVVTVKWSAAIFGALIIIAVLIRFAASGMSFRSIPRRAALLACAGPLLTIMMMTRGVILSGYPLYPLPVLGVNTDWRVPEAQVRAEKVFITTWSRLKPTYDTAAASGYGWVKDWARSTILTDKFTIVLPLLLSIGLLPAAIPGMIRLFRTRESGWLLLPLMTGSLLSIISWFLQAPAGRFIFIHFWILSGCSLALAFPLLTTRRAWLSLLPGIAVAAMLGIWLIRYQLVIAPEFRSGMLMLFGFAGLWLLSFSWTIQRSSAKAAAALLIILSVFQIFDRSLSHILSRRWPALSSMLWLNVNTLDPAAQKRVPWSTRKTDSGLVVYQSEHIYYETPLPNTQFFNRYLELRRPGDLAGGFRNIKTPSDPAYGYRVEVVVAPGTEKQIVFPE